jgi:tyrosine-protein phosphatase SIW14
MIKNFLRACVTSFVMVFSFAAFASAQSAPSDFPNVKIKNFGQMDARFYRGAQPLPDDYQSLKDLGVNTVIDLRNDPTDYEKAAVEALGMRYVNISMSGWKSPKDIQLDEFLKLVDNPETGIFYVHCKAGIHRTGVAGAVYRFNKYGWDYDKAYREMKNFEFSSGLVHGALKSYVKDYYRDILAGKIQIPAVQSAAMQAGQ